MTLLGFLPSGERVLRTDRPIGRQGEEELVLWAEQRGRYQVTLEQGKTDPGGSYELAVRRLGAGSETDHRYAAAFLAFAQAEELRRQRTSVTLGQALPLYDRAEPELQALGRTEALVALRRQRAEALLTLGKVLLPAGEPAAAESALREAIFRWQELSDLAAEAESRNLLAWAMATQGSLREAEIAYREAMAAYHSLGSTADEAVVLGNLGNVFLDARDTQTALDHYHEALNLLPSTAPPASRADLLLKIGWAHLQRGEMQVSRQWFERSRNVARGGKDALAETYALASLARLPYEAGDFAAAEAAFTDAAVRFAGLGGAEAHEVEALQNAAWCQLKRGAAAVAASSFEALAGRAERLGDRRIQAALEGGWARAERDRGNLLAAREHALAAVKFLEARRSGTDRLDLRRSLLADTSEVYDLAVDLLLTLDRQQPGSGFATEAFQVGERSRSRTLLDSLRTTVAGSGADRHRAQLRVNAAERRRQRLAQEGATPAAIEPAERDLRAALEELRELDRRSEVPRAQDDRGSAPVLSLAEAQAALPTEDTAFLVFDLGRERSVLWLVRRGAWEWFPLPAAVELETAAEAVLRLFESGDPRATGARAAPSVRSLTKKLLGDALAHLSGERLVIVPDGVLAALPFAALPLPGQGEPLLTRHEVMSAPSISVALALAERQRGRPAAVKLLAFVGDPLYAADRAGTLTPLPASAREAEAVLALVPANSRLAALREAANKELVLSGGLSEYRVVHFAVHGLLNMAQPELSGLELSQLAAAGHPLDGSLRAHEITRLDLPADLVVLSACETARGANFRGEGIVGLPHAFLEAGASRVLVSLWRVRDVAAAELMERFYRGLWADHLSPSAALRQAQASMWQDPAWSRPRDWAGFVMSGAFDPNQF